MLPPKPEKLSIACQRLRSRRIVAIGQRFPLKSLKDIGELGAKEFSSIECCECAACVPLACGGVRVG